VFAAACIAVIVLSKPFLIMTRKTLLIITIVLVACKSKQEKIKPTIESISSSVYASGLLKSNHQYQVFSKVNGIVQDIFVKEGDAVEKGSTILSIYNEAQQLNKENSELAANFSDFNANQGKLNEAKLNIELAKSKMKNDSALYFRQLNLWQQQIGTKNELELKELSYQNAKTAYSTAIIHYNDIKRQLDFSSAQSKKNVQIASKAQNDFVLKSEMDGIVYSIPIKKGEMASMQTPLAIIGDAKQFVLEMQVDEYDILKVKMGLPVLVTMDSYKGKVFDAVVTKINPLMNERSKTFLVEATFTKQPETLYPNISFEANIVIQSKEKALLIPRNYLLSDSLVVKSNGDTLVVKTGLRDYQKIEILSGISANDELIKPAL
jgi:multidrug efflux pump subunit AcrA (membrane-fusion protein)